MIILKNKGIKRKEVLVNPFCRQAMKCSLILILVGLCCVSMIYGQQSGNPIIKSKYTMDPAVMVYKDNLYLFTGVENSETPYNWPFMATHYNLFSTTDMINFKDHGNVLDANDFKWMPDNYCWASHCVEKDQSKY